MDLSKYDVVMKDWDEKKKFAIRNTIASLIIEGFIPNLDDVDFYGKGYDEGLNYHE